ncbi:hypothetical protein DPMN_030014 [Dreissena polymorpha]|uniref:Uncharacterized protein n=1 Tax=Dreissena polymorpha TaxID=45954 RepID=A0A9D4M1V5_DREPO|nr:hypothetical protein DPMN_030014 [Dreissena polymorpha]
MGIIEKSMNGEQRCIQRDADETTMLLVTSEDIERVFDDRTTVDQASSYASKVVCLYKRSRVRFLGLDPVLGVYGGDLKNAPSVGIEPMTARSLGGHHIHYTTATLTPSHWTNEITRVFKMSTSKLFKHNAT